MKLLKIILIKIKIKNLKIKILKKMHCFLIKIINHGDTF